MKKKTIILMLGLLFSMGSISAQPILRKSITQPRAGDEYIKNGNGIFPH